MAKCTGSGRPKEPRSDYATATRGTHGEHRLTGNPWYSRPAALRDYLPDIRAFMSRTACSRPTITARAMMLWPMFSSHMPSIAAIGWTLR